MGVLKEKGITPRIKSSTTLNVFSRKESSSFEVNQYSNPRLKNAVFEGETEITYKTGALYKGQVVYDNYYLFGWCYLPSV